jgi:uncharacterized protein (DUF58 family)
MSRNQRQVSASGFIILILIMVNAIIIKSAFLYRHDYYWGLLLSVPLLLFALLTNLKKSRFKKQPDDRLPSATVEGHERRE